MLALAELLGSPIGCGDTLFAVPEDHPLARGPANEFDLQAGTDIVLAVDVAVPWLKGPRPRMAAIGADPTFEGTPLYEFPCDWALRCRSDLALAQLVDAVERRLTPAGRERCRARREALSVKRPPAATLREAAQEALGRILGPDGVIFHEMAEPRWLGRTRAGTLFGNGGSAIGWAAAAAVGAKVARPDLQVAAVCGDGSWHFANPVSTLWTAAYHRAPVLIMVLNNGGYRTGTLTVAHDYPEGHAVRARDFEGGWLAPSPDFAAIARACGCFGATVEDIASLEPALAQAAACGAPAVVDVRLPQIGR